MGFWVTGPDGGRTDGGMRGVAGQDNEDINIYHETNFLCVYTIMFVFQLLLFSFYLLELI